MRQVRLVSQKFFLPPGAVLAIALLFGLPVGTTLLEIPGPGRLAINIGTVSVATYLVGYRIKTRVTLVWFVLAYSGAAMVIPMFKLTVRPDWLLSRGMVFYVGIGIAMISVLTCILVWELLRVARGVPILKEPFVCLVCSYSLIGNTSGVCPECGSPIPFEGLQMEPAQFFETAAALRAPGNPQALCHPLPPDVDKTGHDAG